jgi:nitric oxide reductase large subunit
MQTNWKKETLADVVNLILGGFLLVSPWIFGFAAETTASWNAWISGLVIAVLAIAALAAFATWEEWLNLIVGLWVAASPWIVSYSASAAARWVHLIVGLVVAVVAGVRLWLVYRSPPRVTA